MHIRPIFETNPDYHQTTPYYVYNAFTEEELEWIGNLQQLYSYQDANIGADSTSQLDESIRKSKIKWIYHDDKSWWVYDKLAKYIKEANKTWGFAINSIMDSIQYTEYYEGGDLEFWLGRTPDKAPREHLLAILFPSYLMHRVTPITKGVRKSLVLWVGGDTFR